jgi:hypothetical protein
MPFATLQVRGRIVRGEEVLNNRVDPNEVLKVVLPDKSRTNNLLKASKQTPKKGQGGKQNF